MFVMTDLLVGQWGWGCFYSVVFIDFVSAWAVMLIVFVYHKRHTASHHRGALLLLPFLSLYPHNSNVYVHPCIITFVSGLFLSAVWDGWIIRFKMMMVIYNDAVMLCMNCEQDDWRERTLFVVNGRFNRRLKRERKAKTQFYAGSQKSSAHQCSYFGTVSWQSQIPFQEYFGQFQEL